MKKKIMKKKIEKREAHVVVVPLRAPEVWPRGLRRPQHVPVVPQQPPEEGVGHGAGSVRADVGEGQVGVPRAEQPVGEPPRGDEEPCFKESFDVKLWFSNRLATGMRSPFVFC